MLLSVTSLVSSLLLAGLADAGPSRRIRTTGQNNGNRKRTYTPSTINDLIPLGSAGSYSVFTLTGISTVPGTVTAGQVVNGDIGVAPIALTAITGFGAVQEGKSNTLFVTGNIHGPPYSTNTPADVVNAYNVAAGKNPSGPIVTGAGTLDSGVVMTPGVYRWTGALALGVGQILTLNGQCGDIFIFQTAGAITTGANSQVLLTGGLTAATVYWVSATSLTTGVSSAFSGIVLAKTNVVIAGTLVGAVYAQTETALHAATISAPIATLATTQIGSVCNIATCAINYGLSAGACVQCQAGYGSIACTAGTLSCDVNTGFALSCSPGYSGSATTACTGCTPGFASPGGIVSPTNNACTGCSAGFYASSKLSVNCIACPGTAGTDYATCASDTGNDITCPAGLALGSTSKFASNTTCSACLDGYFSLNSAVSCTKCLVGTSTCSATTGYGTACLAGYGSTSTSACSACLGGTYSTSIGTVCSQVPAGSFALGPAATTYSSCAPNEFSAQGASKCTACDSGSSSIDKGISCTKCKDDTHFLDKAYLCTACTVGTAQCDSTGLALNCLPGYFATPGSTCQPCTKGFASLGGPVTSTSTCQACLAGTFTSSNLAASCGPCQGKDFATCAPDTGADVNCPSGSGFGGNTALASTTVCSACSPGYFSVALATVCTKCLVGTSTCSATTGYGTACLAGYSSTSISACSACLGGTYSIAVGTTCSPVPAGSFALGPAATSYSPCATTGTSLAGASSCTPCNTGYSSKDNGITCTRICVDGTHYLDSNSVCQTCSAGTIKCDSNGNALACSPGYSGNALSPCYICPAGSYGVGGVADCIVATIGQYVPTSGATSPLVCLTATIRGSTICCAPGYQLTGGVYPSCEIVCPAGSGIVVNSNNKIACAPCAAAFYNDKQNSCTRCGDFSWSHKNSTTCIPCIYDANTMLYASCDPSSGNPTYCKYGRAGLTKTPLPSPKVCALCLFGYSVEGFSNDCQCQAGYTNVTTTPCLNGIEPVSFNTARIYVTENNNGCKRQLGWLSQTETYGYSTDGSYFGYSLDASKALQVRMPSSISGELTAIQAVTPFGHGYSYLGIQMGSGTLGDSFSSYPLKQMTGLMSASQFVNPGSTFGELALANGFLEFGSIGENATADCWIVNPYDTCRNGYPLSLSLRIPATLGLEAFISNNASFTGNGLIQATPIDNIDFSLLNGNGNNGELQLTLVPN